MLMLSLLQKISIVVVLCLASKPVMLRVRASCLQASDLRAAVEVFRDMQSQEQKPGMITWCYLISSLYKDRRKGLNTLETAYKLWRELQDQAYVRGDKDGSYFATGNAPEYASNESSSFPGTARNLYSFEPHTFQQNLHFAATSTAF